MKRSTFPLAILAICFAAVQPAAAAIFVPFSFGFSVFSVAVGVVGVASSATGIGGPSGTGGRVAQGAGSVAVGALDPSPGTFYTGQVVIDYPTDLLAFDGIGWYGPFAADPSQPTPPISNTAFLATGGPYDVIQGPAAGLDVQITNDSVAGVLTLTFSSSSGITVPGNTDFNFANLLFSNISGQTLYWTVAAPGTANFSQSTPQQYLTCEPNPTYLAPVNCGTGTTNTTATGYVVSPTPEPAVFGSTAGGLACLWVIARRRRVIHA
jgi:hypothetical protein